MSPESNVSPVQSFARGLSVITAFDGEHPEMTLSEIAARTGLARATARRFLHTLIEVGYVTTDGRGFRLTARVLELGFSYLSGLSLPEIAQPLLETLSHEVGESSSASVLDGDDIVYVVRVPTRRIMSVGISIGTRFPAHATSMGRVLLAGLSDAALDEHLERLPTTAYTSKTLTSAALIREAVMIARDQGWALVDGELESGLRSIAVPLRGRDGRVSAAVNVSCGVGTPVESMTRDILPRLLDTAMAIGSAGWLG
ncbi:IclR family transcriptional regulator [Frondihabitans sp. PAMC 28766]|uniref:IclR family transcriptional regulator domain-containing protein n=1 Tax=Frondihabitans sp. PAMC 28766 TaxID=1795630 RepID=UPI00078C1A28|nr:IclR family transcriptional regulator C-terminal domain-containing protein [Frondihabitans sp. PAMC 28766]AMM18925.1 IclR family transcriptional regulator [Frondihabitans sp. PAMC 28766]